MQARAQWSTEEDALDITGCVSLVMQVMSQVGRSSSISRIARGRIIWAHASTKETVLSSSSGGSTEWRRPGCVRTHVPRVDAER